MNPELDSLYQEVIQGLTQGKRPLLKLSPEQFEQIRNEMEVLLGQKDWDPKKLDPLLCLASHVQSYHSPLGETLAKLLYEDLAPNSYIYVLSACEIHVLKANNLLGQRLPEYFLAGVRKILSHPNWEVVEWGVRFIEQLDGQIFYFKEDIAKLKPSGFVLNKHKKSIKQIIIMLEKRWPIILR